MVLAFTTKVVREYGVPLLGTSRHLRAAVLMCPSYIRAPDCACIMRSTQVEPVPSQSKVSEYARTGSGQGK